MQPIYQALYLRYRPGGFSGMLGQEAVVSTLRNQISTGRIAHAYLFCGSRGTGKTTAARVLARAVNCTNPQQGDPCGVCETCVETARENCMDIIEIDAASNNGVGEIRDLREHVRFPPTIGRYKVYIIDEVHMLSPAAFNAFLKTLEEPPAHAIFILATTEPQKLPATVLSRCQRFDFHRIRTAQIAKRLTEITQELQAVAQPEAIWRISQSAEGGMRDALSLLDQCLAFHDQLTLTDVEDVLGASSASFVNSMAIHLLQADLYALLNGIATLQAEGRDLAVFLQDITARLRNLLLASVWQNHAIPKTSDATGADWLELSDDEWEELCTAATDLSQSRLLTAIEALARLEADMKWSEHPRILLESVLCRVAIGETDKSFTPAMEAIEARITALEQRLHDAVLHESSITAQENHISSHKSPKTQSSRKKNIDEPIPTTNEIPVGDALPTKSETLSGVDFNDTTITNLWPEMQKHVKAAKMPLSMMLLQAKIRPAQEGNALVLNIQQEGGVYKDALTTPDNLAILQAAADTVFGTGHPIRIQFETGAAVISNPLQTAIDLFGADIVETDDDEN